MYIYMYLVYHACMHVYWYDEIASLHVAVIVYILTSTYKASLEL